MNIFSKIGKAVGSIISKLRRKKQEPPQPPPPPPPPPPPQVVEEEQEQPPKDYEQIINNFIGFLDESFGSLVDYYSADVRGDLSKFLIYKITDGFDTLKYLCEDALNGDDEDMIALAETISGNWSQIIDCINKMFDSLPESVEYAVDELLMIFGE